MPDKGRTAFRLMTSARIAEVSALFFFRFRDDWWESENFSIVAVHPVPISRKIVGPPAPGSSEIRKEILPNPKPDGNVPAIRNFVKKERRIHLTGLLVGIAGAFGALLRYWIGLTLFAGHSFPFATLFINLSGSFLLAWLTTYFFRRFRIPPALATAIGTGFVGSFTTFSTFSIETTSLFRTGHIALGLIYVLFSIFGGLALSRLGSNSAGRLAIRDGN